MDYDRESKYRPTHTPKTDFQQRHEGASVEKGQPSTNGAEAVDIHLRKPRPLPRAIYKNQLRTDRGSKCEGRNYKIYKQKH